MPERLLARFRVIVEFKGSNEPVDRSNDSSCDGR